MLFCHFLLGFLWLGQAPKTPATHHHHPAAAKVAAAAPVPKGPKSQAELVQDLEAALRAAPFNGDKVVLSVSGKDITLAGEVHSAERKGMATRDARRVAEKDGWNGFHVYNHMNVALGTQD